MDRESVRWRTPHPDRSDGDRPGGDRTDDTRSDGVRTDDTRSDGVRSGDDGADGEAAGVPSNASEGSGSAAAGSDTGSGPSRRRLLAALGAAAAAGVAGCADATTDSPDAGDLEVSDDATAVEYTPSADEGAVTRVYRESISAVVLVRVFTSTGGGQGSGILIDDRHVVTNEHVVAGAEAVETRFSRGQWSDATVVGTDPYSDLAVVRVEDVPDYAGELGFVQQEPPIGSPVVVIGNPFGLGGSVSSGIISGVDRSLEAPNNFPIADTVQTDAAVNPGNSGGPMLTLDGAVVAVVSAGGGENIGFGISAALTKRVVPELIEDGEYEHPYVGIATIPVSPLVADANDLPEARGVFVVEVQADTPADGNLQGSDGEVELRGVDVPTGGDVIVGVDGQSILTQSAFSTYLALNKSPGDDITVTVLRDGERETVEFTLGRRPPPSS